VAYPKLWIHTSFGLYPIYGGYCVIRDAPLKMRRPPKTTPWMRSYIRKAHRLRDRLSDKALAAKFHLSPAWVGFIGRGQAPRAHWKGKQSRSPERVQQMCSEDTESGPLCSDI